MGQRNLVSYSPWGCKESDTTERLTHTHTLSILNYMNKPNEQTFGTLPFPFLPELIFSLYFFYIILF